MGGKKMIYSARLLEVHTNVCSCEADSEEEARQKFLSDDVEIAVPGDDCLGSEYIGPVAIIDIQKNPDHDVDLIDITDPEECMKLLNFNLTKEEFITLMYCLNEKLAEHEHYLHSCTISHQGQKAQKKYIATIRSIRGKFLGAKDKLIDG